MYKIYAMHCARTNTSHTQPSFFTNIRLFHCFTQFTVVFPQPSLSSSPSRTRLLHLLAAFSVPIHHSTVSFHSLTGIAQLPPSSSPLSRIPTLSSICHSTGFSPRNHLTAFSFGKHLQHSRSPDWYFSSRFFQTLIIHLHCLFDISLISPSHTAPFSSVPSKSQLNHRTCQVLSL